MLKYYQYGLFWKFGIFFFLLMTISALGAVGFMVAEGMIGGAFLGLLAVVEFMFFCVWGVIDTATVSIGADGITSYVLGRKAKSIPWEDVGQIKKNRPRSARHYGYSNSFYIDDREARLSRKFPRNLRGSIWFNDSIRGFEELWDRINDYALRYSIPIIESEEVARDLAMQDRSGHPGGVNRKLSDDQSVDIRTILSVAVSARSKRYRYGPSLALLFSWQFVLFVVFPTTMTIFASEFGWPEYTIVFPIAAIMSTLLFMRIFLLNSPVSISDTGVTAYKFGIRMKTIRWRDVRKIKKIRYPAMGAYCEHTFYVYDGEAGFFGKLFPNLLSPIVFRDEIKAIWDLLDQLNYYAEQYDLPLVMEDQAAAIEQKKWSRSSLLVNTKPTEVRVSRF